MYLTSLHSITQIQCCDVMSYIQTYKKKPLGLFVQKMLNNTCKYLLYNMNIILKIIN